MERTEMSRDVRATLESAAKYVAEGADAHMILSAAHALWLLVCGSKYGGRVDRLLELAEAFEREATSLVPDLPIAAAVGNLGRGCALLRAGNFREAEETLAEICGQKGSHAVLAVAARCWQVIAATLAGRYQPAHRYLLEGRKLLGAPNTGASPLEGHVYPPLAAPKATRASSWPNSRRTRQSASLPDRVLSCVCLNGWLEYAGAFLDYKNGCYEAAQARLDGIRTAFRSGPQAELVEYPAFEAEALLLQAKLFRETGRHEQALTILREAELQRQQTDDVIGCIWGLIEKARIYRFWGDYKGARRELQDAEARLQRTDFADWRARLEDQFSDIYRLEGDLRRANSAYQNAVQLAAASRNPFLHGHLANTKARLLLETGTKPALQEALQLLQKHERTWKTTKAFGKYLYLRAEIQIGLGNRSAAELDLTNAVAHLHKCSITYFEALALARLAELCADQRKPAEACQHWSKALRIAPAVQAKGFLERLEERANRMRSADLVPVIAALVEEKATLRQQIQGWKDAEADALERHWFESYLLSHRLLQPLSAVLASPEQHPLRRSGVLQEFAALLQNAEWYAQDLSHAPAQPVKSVDVCAAATRCGEAVSQKLNRPIRIQIPKKKCLVPVNERCLNEAIAAVLRGAATAFGTEKFRLSVHERPHDEFSLQLEFVLLEPAPAHFECAQELVALDTVLSDTERLLPFFAAGYSGHLTLAEFLVVVFLWGKLEFAVTPPTIIIKLPRVAPKNVEPS